jgi:hypothetical protein
MVFQGELADEEDLADESWDEKPQKSKRINSGKLFWYIRSKSYVPVTEIRRRFELSPNEMSVLEFDGHRMYVGLPRDVADAVANLKRQDKIGIECSPDFGFDVVVGLYPMRRA